MYKVRTYNQISVHGLERFGRDTYEVASELAQPDAILLRSHNLRSEEILPTVKAVARAGAGVNNVPVTHCTERGIPVFNTPGANANAVKELVLAGLLLSARGIIPGMEFVRSLTEYTDHKELSALLEKEKKQFKGSEIAGKTLGVVGLGAIGSLVAETGLALGMKVVGYDPALSVEAAWRLPRDVQRMENLASLLSRSDYVSLHLPVFESTRNLINNDSLRNVKTGAVLLNFAREEIVDTGALIAALNDKRLGRYVSDFPTPELIERSDVMLMPHIGASTDEAEDNCAVMAADQLKDYLENGNIRNSVNFPTTYLERTPGFRLAVSNRNVPKILGSILAVLADANINVIDMINKSRDDIAYNLIDLGAEPSQDVIEHILKLEGVVSVRRV